MGQLGKSKEGYYPDLTLTEAIELVHRIIDAGGRISRTGLARLIGIDPRGQGLATRVKDLKEYGLVEGDGQLQASELAQTIVTGNTGKAWEAFVNVPLYAQMHDRLKGKEPPDKVVLQNILYEITKADEDAISRRSARLKNNYMEALQYFSSGPTLGGQRIGQLQPQGGWPMDQKGPTLGGLRIGQPQPQVTSLPILDSDFFLYDKEQKVFISIDNADKLELAQKHLDNSKKRFHERKASDKKTGTFTDSG